MLTKLICRNFKNFGEVEIELGNPVVFIGPNNSGKTTALQALALWEIGLKRWNENRKGKTNPERHSGVTINRLDLISIQYRGHELLWRNQQVRDAEIVNGKQRTQNIRIDIIVEGITDARSGSVVLNLIMPIRSPSTAVRSGPQRSMEKCPSECLFLRKSSKSLCFSFHRCPG